MKPLVLQFQEDLVSGKRTIGDLLRMAKMIAAKLGQEDLCEWFDHELNGYPLGMAVPKYRLIGGGQLEVRDPHFGWQQAITDPLNEIPIHEAVTKLELFGPKDRFYWVSSVKLPLTDEDGNSEPIMSYPQRVEFPIANVIAIVEAVKTRLVDWSTELEKQRIVGENMSFKDEEKASAKSQVFNIGSMTGGFIGDASHSTVQVTSYGNVLSLLEASTVPEAEKDELKQILQKLEQATPEKKPALREKVSAWLLKNGEFVGTALGGFLKSYMAQ